MRGATFSPTGETQITQVPGEEMWCNKKPNIPEGAGQDNEDLEGASSRLLQGFKLGQGILRRVEEMDLPLMDNTKSGRKERGILDSLTDFG